MIEYKCAECGKICTAKYPSLVKKYCSHKCANVARWENEPRKIIEKKCGICGKAFSVRKSDTRLKDGGARYCSKNCASIGSRKRKPRKCLNCGEEFYPYKITRKFCSRKCACEYQSTNCNHKPYMENGYVVEYVKGYNKKNCVKQHRRIMEEYLGRKLTANEVVHHINGNRKDNRLENLVVMTKGEHSSLHRKSEKAIGKHLFGGYHNN